MTDFVLVARNVSKQEFGSEPGRSRFLNVPGDAAAPRPEHAIGKRDWFVQVRAAAASGKNEITGEDCGDILIFVHGYNNDQQIVMRRHRRIRGDLAARGYQGAVVSFDWPSDDQALNYLEDRSDAKQTAIQLVEDLIKPFSVMQQARCEINVHLFAHSTGAYVIREAFDDADDRPRVAESSWTVSQVLFAAADISAKSMSADNAKTSSLYRHCVRLTNYSNPYDSVLKLSNVKRIGVAPRAGRKGLPPSAPQIAVNVNCGPYWQANEDSLNPIGNRSHSWHIGDPTFATDMLHTLRGDLDRLVIPTRRIVQGELFLSKPNA